MNHITRARKLLLIVLAAFCCGVTPRLSAEEFLFFGNSFTFGAGSEIVQKNGGVPKLVEAIATSKGKTIATQMLTVGGKDLEFHLQRAKTDETLKLKPWDRIVLQGYSLEATHLRDPALFLKNGEIFYKRIRESSPRAKVVLYQTWARAPGHPLYTGTSTSKSFIDPVEMNREIQENYGKLARQLEDLEPGTQVELAPVGQAFARSLEKHPDLKLHSGDKYHASTEGSYLAALVIYATIFQDSPVGATREFRGTSLDAEVAAKLQDVAREVTER